MKKARKAAPTKARETVRGFASDFRTTNPALHNLYVRGAYEDLHLAKEAIAALEARLRVPASIMAAALRQAMVEEIESDAAFFEAAALLFAGLKPPPETEEEA
jgi:hypothetical protein